MTAIASVRHRPYHHTKQLQGETVATQAESFDYIVTGAGSAGCAVAARLSNRGGIACCCWKLAARIAIRGSTSRWASPRSTPTRASTGCTRANPRRSSAGAGCISRAARCSAAPARSTAWCTCAATRPTMTNGVSAAAPAGTGTACCRISRRPNTRSAARTSSTASAVRLHVSDQPRRSELADRVVEAAIQAGLPPIEDFNDGRQEGAGYFQSTTGGQRRWSTATAYLRPARGRDQPCGAPERARDAHPDRERSCRGRHLRQRRGVAHRTGEMAR